MRPQAFTAPLPNSRTRSVSLLALFAAVQLADGVMTFAAVERFGPSVEGNPLLFFYFNMFGVGLTLIGAKSIAIVLATALHVRGQHLTLAILTVMYVLAAIQPWAWAIAFGFVIRM
jgi:hypothetical protein